MKIKFCGAATSVTGSCHLLTSGDHQILLDCGQFQGNKVQEQMNHEEFPFDPAQIECVVLSHAHIDHCGRIPLLIKRGFKGTIYCSSATADLLDVMLKDSGYIHEKEAEWQNRKNERAGRPLIEPLYTYNDAVDSLKYVKAVEYDQLISINDDIKVVFNDAGHILGSAIIELFVNENDSTSKIVFSGDLGVVNRPILNDPTIIKKADYVIMETTYGNRVHPKEGNNMQALLDIIINTARRGGTTVIPSFAVGRTQELIYELNRYYESDDNSYHKELKKLKVYVDSPMAYAATEVFKNNAQVYDQEMREFIMRGDNPLDFPGLEFTKTSEESQAINMDHSPKIIISASGMCEAGRIRHHLKHNLWDKNSSIVFVGYQAEGTLGRTLIEGVDQVTLFGERIQVNAEIHNLEGFSGHADRDGLFNWISGFEKRPKQIFLVHGETESKEAFAYMLKEKLGYDPVIVREISEFELESATMISMDETIKDFMETESLDTLKLRVASVQDTLNALLKSPDTITNGDMTASKLSELKNLIVQLEKDAVNLGSAITDRT
ncbi:MAG: MBL fold metallo-hydrolase [Anaerovoracaceae bacterium]|jgi:metallo-beta-lactamase family protein|nr:MBL fold metallo-hydrolase [Anaerovoracaceae bacterium]